MVEYSAFNRLVLGSNPRRPIFGSTVISYYFVGGFRFRDKGDKGARGQGRQGRQGRQGDKETRGQGDKGTRGQLAALEGKRQTPPLSPQGGNRQKAKGTIQNPKSKIQNPKSKIQWTRGQGRQGEFLNEKIGFSPPAPSAPSAPSAPRPP